MEDLAKRDKEYSAALNSAGIIDRSASGLIQVTGDDRVEFLQRMTTNDMVQLKSKAVVQTVLTTAEARIVDLLEVYSRPESLLVVTSSGNGAKILQWFRGQIFFRDKVRVADARNKYLHFALVGPKVQAVLAAAGLDVADLAVSQGRDFLIDGCQVFIVCDDDAFGKRFQVLVSGTEADQFRAGVLRKGKEFGLTELHAEAQEMLRIASGMPAWDRELREEYNALEAGLRDAISFSKGCYTGQEVIARLDTYQKLKQSLVQVLLAELPSGSLPLKIMDEKDEAGTLTSVAIIPDGVVLGLGYIRTKYLAGERGFKLVDGDRQIPVQVRRLSQEARVP